MKKVKRVLGGLFMATLLLTGCGLQDVVNSLKPPANPSSFTATAMSDTEIKLAWAKVEGVSNYTLERKTGQGGYSQVGTPSSSQTEYTDSGLSAGTIYTYRLKAVSSSGSSGGMEASATTTGTVTNPPGGGGDAAPDNPTNLTATPSSTSVTLNWTAAPGATSYSIERKTGSEAFVAVGTVATTTTTDGGLTASTSYTYRVKAVNAKGSSSGVEVSATTTAGNTGNPEINNYFSGLPIWDSVNPAPATSETAGASSSNSSTLPDSSAESGQRKYECTVTQYTLQSSPDKIVTFNPDAGSLWVGSMLQGQGYVNGIGSLSELPIRERAPVKLFISLLGPGVTKEVAVPSGASVQQAVADLVIQAKQQNTPVPAVIDYKKEIASSSEEFMLKLGFSVKYMSVSVKGKLDVNRKASEKTVMAYFIQNAFTASLVTPQSPADWFSSDFTLDDLKEQERQGRLGQSNLPVYVSDISYGRILMVSMTSSDSDTDIKAALDFAYTGGASVDVNTEAKYRSILGRADIRVTSIGGDENAVLGLIRSGNLDDYFKAPADLATMRPISYQIRDVAGNRTAKFGETTTYNLQQCIPQPNKSIDVGDVAKFTVIRGYIPRDCPGIVDKRADVYGEININGSEVWKTLRDNNFKVDPRAYFAVGATLPPTTTPPDLNIPPLLAGERVFLDSSGGGFRLEGRLKDFEGIFGDPENNYDVTERYSAPSNVQPNQDYSGFAYGIKVLEGGSKNCAMNLEYNLEKIRDIRQYVP
jgi:Thiol-activated cytolysin/Fibronectin type III domain